MSEEIEYESHDNDVNEFGESSKNAESNDKIDDITNNDNENEDIDENLSSQQIFKQTDLGLIAGKRGSGKTNLLLYLIQLFTKLQVNLIIVDPVYDLSTSLQKITGSSKEDPRIVHIPYGNRKLFDKLLEKLFAQQWKGIIIVDEADRFFPNRQKLSAIEDHFIQIGRHHGIGGIFVTRRLAKLHTDLPSQANKIFLFKHWQRADLDYLRESNLGDYTYLLKVLEKYHFMYLNTDENECIVCNPVQQMK